MHLSTGSGLVSNTNLDPTVAHGNRDEHPFSRFNDIQNIKSMLRQEYRARPKATKKDPLGRFPDHVKAGSNALVLVLSGESTLPKTLISRGGNHEWAFLSILPFEFWGC